MGDYVRWSPPYYEGAEDSAQIGAVPRAEPQQALDPPRPQDRARASEVLLRLAREHDVLLESFRPGVLDRLGVGYERLREENPGLVYCAITGYGQDGPKRDARRPRHELPRRSVGLLGLTGERGGAPVQAAGQIADLGGGALMAAFGILAALRERERSGEGQLVDVSMVDGALSWLAMVAATLLRRRRGAAAAASSPLAGALVCYRPYECADGWVTLRRAGAEVLAGVVPRRRPRGPDRAAVRRARAPTAHRAGRGDLPRAHARAVGGVRAPSTTAAWSRCSTLDEALDSELVARARDGRRARPAGRASAGAPARPAGQARRARPATTRARPARRSASTPTRCSRRPATAPRRSPTLQEPARWPGRPARRRDRSWRLSAHGGRARAAAVRQRADGLLKMSELAERSGVSAGTIKHYLREGLLGGDDEIVRTSRNMAYYPPEFVERIALIKRLQEERFMPLRVIGRCCARTPSASRR